MMWQFWEFIILEFQISFRDCHLKCHYFTQNSSWWYFIWETSVGDPLCASAHGHLRRGRSVWAHLPSHPASCSAYALSTCSHITSCLTSPKMHLLVCHITQDYSCCGASLLFIIKFIHIPRSPSPSTPISQYENNLCLLNGHS